MATEVGTSRGNQVYKTVIFDASSVMEVDTSMRWDATSLHLDGSSFKLDGQSLKLVAISLYQGASSLYVAAVSFLPVNAY